MKNFFHINKFSQKALGTEKRWIFYTIAAISAFGNALDLFLMRLTISHPIFYVNVFTVLLSLLLIVLRIKRKVPLHTATAVLLYTLVINFVISQIFSIDLMFYEGHYFRLSFYVWIIMLLAGFTINKRHVIYLSCSQLALFLIAISSGNQYILENSSTIVLGILIYSFCVYYILLLLERFYEKTRSLAVSLSSEKKHIKSVDRVLKQEADMKNRLFSIISHDLKNHSNLMLNFSILLQKRLAENETDAATKMADALYQATENNNTLLINLLEWAKTQTGSSIFTPQTIDIEALLEDIKLYFEHTAEFKSISLTIDNEINKPVTADPIMLSSTLRNLVSNAIKFSPTSGKVSIEARMHPDYFSLKVSDHGVGMSSTKIKQLISGQPAHSTRGTNDEKGSGLGFSICQNFIQKHGGKISIGSIEGKGTEVLVNIPQ